MQKVNKKQYAVIDKLVKSLKTLQDQMKQDIYNDAEYSFDDFAKITVSDMPYKAKYSEDDQAKIDAYIQEQGFVNLNEGKTYKRINLSKVDPSADDIVNDIVNAMLQSTNDFTASKVADKLANIIK